MFTLTINGGSPLAFSDLGISHARLETTNAAQDVLELTLASETQALQFTQFAKVQLYHNDQIRFTGWVDQLPVSYNGNAREWSVVVNGPWRFLDLCAYSSEANIFAGSLQTVKTQIPMLGQGVNTSGVPIHIPIRDVIADAVHQVLARFPGVFTAAAVPDALAIQAPWSEKQNVTCGSVVRDQLGWVPGFSLWWDYSQPTPVLTITDVPATPSWQVNEELDDIVTLKLTPRFDLLVREVDITYVVRAAGYSAPAYFDSAGPAGDAATLGSPSSVQMSFALQTNETPPDQGLAQAYQKSMGKLAVETRATITDESFAWGKLPGQLWGFQGVSSRWAAYTSVCQKITRDLFTASVDIQIGHPTQVGLQRLIDLHRKNVPQGGSAGGAGSPAASQVQQGAPPNPGNRTGSVTVATVIGTGNTDDQSEMLASTIVQLSGPGGNFQMAASQTGAQFTGLTVGTYLASVQPAPGWKQADTSIGQQVYVSGGIGAEVTLTLVRCQKVLLADQNNFQNTILMDAGDQTDGPVVKVKGGNGQEYTKSTTTAFILHDPTGVEVTIDVPSDNKDKPLAAEWHEIAVVKDGKLQLMKMLGSTLYDPPTPSS